MPAITLEGNQQTNTTSAGLEEWQQRGDREKRCSDSLLLLLPTVPGTAGFFVNSWLMDKQLTSVCNDYFQGTAAGLHNSGFLFLF